jgi:hypothetical protein
MSCTVYIPYGLDILVTVCGKGNIQVCSKVGCNREAMVLCDAPTRNGKTCDVPLCYIHAAEIAPDVHLCPFHARKHGHDGTGPLPVTLATIDDHTLCRDKDCLHARRCARWTGCRDTGVKIFDFASTKAASRFRCRWFMPIFIK